MEQWCQIRFLKIHIFELLCKKNPSYVTKLHFIFSDTLLGKFINFPIFLSRFGKFRLFLHFHRNTYKNSYIFLLKIKICILNPSFRQLSWGNLHDFIDAWRETQVCRIKNDVKAAKYWITEFLECNLSENQSHFVNVLNAHLCFWNLTLWSCLGVLYISLALQPV